MRETIAVLAAALIALGSQAASGQDIVSANRLRLSTGPCLIRSGTGSPEGVLLGRPCDTYVDAASGTWWAKWTGTGTSGWQVGFNANARATGTLTVSGYVSSPTFASQTTGWRIDALGAADVRYLYADELHAKSFVADLEQALAGGQIIAKSVAMVAAPFGCPSLGGSNPLVVRDLPSAAGMAVFESSDTVVVRAFSRAAGSLTIADCVGVVTDLVMGSGTQQWTLTRLTGGNGGTMPEGTVVAVDSLAIDYGTSGNGYYEVSAVDGLHAVNAPYAQVVTWSGAPVAANRTVRARVGNLRGITGSTEYGAILGTYGGADTGRYLRASETAFEAHNLNVSLYEGGTETIRLDRAGPSFALGNAVPPSYSVGPGVWMGNDGGTYKFRVGDPGGARLQWDGSALTIVGDGGGITNINGSNIQTGTISGALLTVGTGRNQIRNADCAVSTADWAIGSNSGFTPGLGFSLAGFRLDNRSNTCFLNVSGTPASGSFSFASTSTAAAYPVQAGLRYEASAYLGVQRTGETVVAIQWYDALGAFVSQVNGSPCTIASIGGDTLAEFCRSGVVTTAPATATTARVIVLTTHTGEVDPYVFFVHAYFGQGLLNQTELTPWGPAGITEIDGGVIRTGAITADKLAVGTLSAITANLGTVTAGSLSGVTAVFGGVVTLDGAGISIGEGTTAFNSLKWSDGSRMYGSAGNVSILTGSGGQFSVTSGSYVAGSAQFDGFGKDLGSTANPWGTAYLTGVRATSLAGTGTRVVCVAADGSLVAGTTTGCL